MILRKNIKAMVDNYRGIEGTEIARITNRYPAG